MKEFNSGGSVSYIVITYEEDIHLVIDVLKVKLEFVLLLVVVVKLAYIDIGIGDTYYYEMLQCGHLQCQD